MSACCDAAGGRPPTWARSVREIFAWVLPSAMLVLVPKCPACLAAHVTLWTGVGLSFSTATYLRWFLLLLCVASLLLLVAKRLGARHVTQAKGERHEHESRSDGNN
jgi:hypothetical protein